MTFIIIKEKNLEIYYKVEIPSGNYSIGMANKEKAVKAKVTNTANLLHIASKHPKEYTVYLVEDFGIPLPEYLQTHHPELFI